MLSCQQLRPLLCAFAFPARFALQFLAVFSRFIGHDVQGLFEHLPLPSFSSFLILTDARILDISDERTLRLPQIFSFLAQVLA